MRFPFLLFALLWVACHSTPALPVPGEFDRTFGQNGIANFPTDAGSVAYFVTTDPAGRVMATGKDRGNEFLSRLQPNGNLDTSFNSVGFVRGTVGTIDRFGDTLLGHTGQWISNLAGGQMLATRVDITSCRPEICRFRSQTVRARRFNADGSLVAAANGDVEVSSGLRPTQVVEQTTGGQVFVTSVAAYFGSMTWLARLGENGLVDESFRASAPAPVTCSGLGDDTIRQSSGTSLALSGGKVLLAQRISSLGSDRVNACVSRLNPDGTLDRSYGNGGDRILDSLSVAGLINAPIALFATGNSGAVLLLQQTVRGVPFDHSQYLLVWLTAQGSIDTARPGQGISGPTELPFSVVTAAAMQRDGKIVFVGYPASEFPIGGEFVDRSQPRVARLLAQGGIDFTFGTGGQGYMPLLLSGKRLTPNQLHIAEDGSVFVAGATANVGPVTNDEPTQFAVAKLQGDPAPTQPAASQSSGGGGGGCGMIDDSRVDPTLPGLALLALLALWGRRRKVS